MHLSSLAAIRAREGIETSVYLPRPACPISVVAAPGRIAAVPPCVEVVGATADTVAGAAAARRSGTGVATPAAASGVRVARASRAKGSPRYQAPSRHAPSPRASGETIAAQASVTVPERSFPAGARARRVIDTKGVRATSGAVAETAPGTHP